jgi:hypothetical protein
MGVFDSARMTGLKCSVRDYHIPRMTLTGLDLQNDSGNFAVQPVDSQAETGPAVCPAYACRFESLVSPAAAHAVSGSTPSLSSAMLIL